MAPTGDSRFASLATDPKYRLPSTKHGRVQVDKRFSRMFKDQDFNRKAKVDRYGRKIRDDGNAKLLSRLYTNDDDERNKSTDPTPHSDPEDEVKAELGKLQRRQDPARQGGFEDSSSSSASDSDSSSEDDSDNADVDVAARLPDQQQDAQIPMGEASSRLAVVNLDWDNIRAVDIFAVAQSFAPSTGGIVDVKVYPSEFGRERIEREALDGPPREIFAPTRHQEEALPESDDSDQEEEEEEEEEDIKDRLLQPDEGKEFDSASLRAYQLQRLRYYFAVITCTSESVAKALYDAMDGREYLSTANFFDMRFIPDGVDFDQDKPRDQCRQTPAGYKPNEFVTDALTHSKVKLTWDNDDTTRKEVQKRAFSRAEIDENDIQAYIGGDSSSEQSDDPGQDTKSTRAEAQRQQMRKALGLSDEHSKKSTTIDAAPHGDMQITFASGLSNAKEPGSSVFENQPIKDETTIDKYVRNEKERKARRKEKAKATRSSKTDEQDTTNKPPKPVSEDDQPSQNPFDDPFFGDAATSQKAQREKRKADKRAKREQTAAEQAAAAAERSELEKLMVDDRDDQIRHFDMNEIRKAEKLEAKSHKNKKKQKKRNMAIDLGESQQQQKQGEFEMQTSDPRFAGLFQSHEYAIDPTNPRFTATKGMKALLEEGRKRKLDVADTVPASDDGGNKKRGKRQEDVRSLVAKVKERATGQ